MKKEQDLNKVAGKPIIATTKTRDEVIKVIYDKIDGDIDYVGSALMSEKLATDIFEEIFGKEGK